ncbi:MICOS complex subunit MIC26-like [Thalassophryne amazonica]|uniref:MICOS complex subunit MIC26-like n=1 Tax=Thalassophryne amazonica TaxID=390379 RepID=UPI001471EBCE|nr:MICOS complex subunit MIC26-like [Thalassophryne amazonica]
MPGGRLTPTPFTVFAADGDGDKAAEAPLNRDQLSLYTEPERRCRVTEPETGQLEQSVAAFRKLVEPHTTWCKSKLQGALRVREQLKDPPKDFYPRAGVIGLAGVLGLVLGRGSRLKRVLYPAGLMALGAGLYYPEQAAGALRSGGETLYECAVRSCAAAEDILKPRTQGVQTRTESKPEPGGKL